MVSAARWYCCFFSSDLHFCFQSECVELGSNIFTAEEIKQQEKGILQHLQWQMRPVTPYEFMHHIVLYDARMEKTLQHSILHQSQIVIDFSLCGLCPHFFSAASCWCLFFVAFFLPVLSGVCVYQNILS
jgi:hypothetical protein